MIFFNVDDNKEGMTTIVDDNKGFGDPPTGREL